MYDLDTWWRAGNAVLALLALVLLAVRVSRMWRRYSVRTRLLSLALLFFLFATTVGSVENISQGNPLGVRTALITAACLWVVAALLTPPGDATAGYDVESS